MDIPRQADLSNEVGCESCICSATKVACFGLGYPNIHRWTASSDGFGCITTRYHQEGWRASVALP